MKNNNDARSFLSVSSDITAKLCASAEARLHTRSLKNMKSATEQVTHHTRRSVVAPRGGATTAVCVQHSVTEYVLLLDELNSY